MIINGNKKNKFRRKHVVKVTFHNIFFKKKDGVRVTLFFI